jgi:hypothetical protein
MNQGRRITYANVASTLALAVALGSGGAYAAALAKNTVGSKQIQNHAIKAKDLASGSVTGAVVADGSLSAVDLAAGTLPTSLPGRIIVQRVDVALPAGAGAGTPGAATSGFIGCQSGQKLIGGSVNVSDVNNSEVLISRPSLDNVGAGGIPDDGQTFTFWKGTARTTTNVAATMRVFAFCSVP